MDSAGPSFRPCVLDMIAPQTGGTDPKTRKPERLYPLGDMKDVVHLFQDPYAMVIPYMRRKPSIGELIQAWVTHGLNATVPIPLQTKYGPTSGFSLPEKIVGMRPAGMNLTDPARAEALKRHREQLAWQRRKAHERREARVYGSINP